MPPGFCISPLHPALKDTSKLTQRRIMYAYTLCWIVFFLKTKYNGSVCKRAQTVWPLVSEATYVSEEGGCPQLHSLKIYHRSCEWRRSPSQETTYLSKYACDTSCMRWVVASYKQAWWRKNCVFSMWLNWLNNKFIVIHLQTKLKSKGNSYVRWWINARSCWEIMLGDSSFSVICCS